MIDMKKLSALKTEVKIRDDSKERGKGVLTIVYSKNGKRIEILEPLVKELQLETTVQFGIIDKGLVIGERLPGIQQVITLKNSGKKKVIYSSDLVREIIKELGLDFNNRVSLTLSGVELQECEGKMIARIYVENQEVKANG